MSATCSLAQLLTDPRNAVGIAHVAAETSGMSLASHRAPAHEFQRGVTSDLWIVAQQNIASTSALMDFGFGWREHFCASPKPVYLIPGEAAARWRLDAESQCVFLCIDSDEIITLLDQFDVKDGSEFLWSLASHGFEESLVHDLIWRLWYELVRTGDNPLLSSSYKIAIVHALTRRSVGLREAMEKSIRRLGNAQLRCVLAAIHETSNQSISIGQLSSLCGLSPHHFMRLFKNTTGRSAYRYYEEVRQEKAKLLLSSGELEISEIGQRLGYAGPSQFSRSFHKLEGCSPRQYRQQTR